MSKQPGRWWAVCGKHLRAPFQAVGHPTPRVGSFPCVPTAGNSYHIELVGSEYGIRFTFAVNPSRYGSFLELGSSC